MAQKDVVLAIICQANGAREEWDYMDKRINLVKKTFCEKNAVQNEFRTTCKR